MNRFIRNFDESMIGSAQLYFIYLERGSRFKIDWNVKDIL